MQKLAVIGNCQYNALTRADGNIAWMCWPRFDSSFVFGNLLDTENGGNFKVAPVGGGTGKQEYITNTNIVRTRFTSSDGVFDVIDFAPRYWRAGRYFRPNILVRTIVPVQGQPLIRVECQPRYDYGKTVLKPELGFDGILYSGGDVSLRLTTDLSLSYVMDGRPFVLSGKRHLILTQGESLTQSVASTAEEYLDLTTQYWRRWVKHCHLPEYYQRQVIRSALTLKLHQYDDTGAIIAASTTSIPEAPNSSRNWDYRYCWLRDAYFTVQALMRLSHFEEAEGFERFLRDTIRADDGKVRPLYTITGDYRIDEREIDMLAGYRGQKPVRVGNAACWQIQNDIYGQALLALSPLFFDVRFLDDGSARAADLLNILVDGIEATMDQPDSGIWEFRSEPQVYAFTTLMHWAGARAAAKAAIGLKNMEFGERCLKLADTAKKRLYEHYWNADLQTLVMVPRSDQVDASLLMAINLGFMDSEPERASRMIDVIQAQLGTPAGLLRRYALENDGLGSTTSSFTICSFWMVEALAHVGRKEEAVKMFEKILSHGNAVGLFSEDIDPSTGELWGNFPQTYSHVGIINASFAINNALGADDIDLTRRMTP